MHAKWPLGSGAEERMTDHKFSEDLRQRITARLARFDVQTTDREDLRRAAVALIVTPAASGDDASIVVTLRPQKINRHSGQYALPGGRLDEGESDVQAALREVDEELGLSLPSSDVLGRLDDFPTRSGFCITPIVAWGADLTGMRPDPGEVASVHNLSFSELTNPVIPRLTESEAGEHPVLSAFFPSLGHHIFAPTAAILYQFREVAILDRPTRAAHFEQPAFAWK